MELPNEEERKGIIELKLQKVKNTIDDEVIKKVARDCVGFTGSDLESMVNEAVYAMREGNMEVVTSELLDEAYENIRVGINLEVNF